MSHGHHGGGGGHSHHQGSSHHGTHHQSIPHYGRHHHAEYRPSWRPFYPRPFFRQSFGWMPFWRPYGYTRRPFFNPLGCLFAIAFVFIFVLILASQVRWLVPGLIVIAVVGLVLFLTRRRGPAGTPGGNNFNQVPPVGPYAQPNQPGGYPPPNQYYQPGGYPPPNQYYQPPNQPPVP